ncbi:hypothetical protein TMEN_9685 [Trichophyton mentagrophytes]|uniref:Uncharacterized protein n=1 Tax=Trichophyton interdigitale (strain MR816) TaxID=1215338 RepID=A0A059JA87_TRIIM|nr:hypothetical protein H109_03696 [Trichophyton interdigitale MR816]GBF66962.1 hypothetical protein TMEN_9685 [Trichophyton mentagrophytes]
MASARHQKIEAATARLMETEQTREEEEAAQHSGREEMNRYRNIPGRAAPSKATPTTVCQKCLKKDSYECTTQLQERPYGARPSRTQQLSNPRLRPQLSTEVPNDLLRTKGVADEQLRRAKEKRARLNPSRSPDRESDYGDAAPGSRKRARSVSSFSSVSTISTNRSPSPPPPRRARQDPQPSRPSVRSPSRRQRSATDGLGEESDTSDRRSRGSRRRHDDHNTRRHRRTRYSDSPEPYRRHDRSRSRDDVSRTSRRAYRERERSIDDDNRHGTPGSRDRAQSRPHVQRQPVRNNSPPRQRSLSPYSKRLALTQAMNAPGR